jgi:CubicO group peptidase (beta-lactamase class C family)
MSWDAALAESIERHQVVGASLSVYDGERTVECAAGVLNLRTGHPATTDSLFLVGSITKVFTATLVLGLVEEGRISLDDRVLELLPELTVPDRIDPAPMTVAHLLTHSNGFESDNFADFGRGEDALVRFVASMCDMELVHPPGDRFSYSNSGYSILGRIVEVVTGDVFLDSLRERVLGPLGLERATTLADEAILYPVAIGHYLGDNGMEPTRTWTASRACEPEGMLAAPSGEILQIALDHLRALQGEPGTLLSSETARLMHERSIATPPVALPQTRQGLGWATFASDGGPVVGHDGSIFGQAGVLRADLARGTAITLLTNCDPAHALAVYWDLLDAGLRDVVSERTGADPQPTALAAVDRERMPGTYRRLNRTLRIRADGDRLLLSIEDEGGLLAEHNDANPIQDRPLIPFGEGLFRVDGVDPAAPESAVAWADPDPERDVAYVYYRGRVARRTETP